MVACVGQWLKVLDVQEDVVVLARWVGALSHNLLQGLTHTPSQEGIWCGLVDRHLDVG